MRRPPAARVDLRPYPLALAHLVRNPALIVVPLVTLVAGVLLREVMAPFSAGVLGGLTLGLVQLVAALLALLGLGSACILADDIWRHGRGTFDAAWTETQRRSSEIVSAAIGATFVFFIAQYAAQLLGTIGWLLMALAAFGLIWAIPAAAVGGIPGGAAIQASFERVRAAPVPAAIATIVSIALFLFAAPLAAGALTNALAGGFPYAAGTMATALLGALLQAVALAYIALVLAKTYADEAFTRRFW